LSDTDSPTGRLHHQLNVFLSRLDEQQRRWYAALESKRIGHGGDRVTARITGLSEATIRRGRRELDAELADRSVGRIREAGGGRPVLEMQDPALAGVLAQLLESETAGAPQGPGKSKRSSLRQLSACLQDRGHPAGRMTIGRLLKKAGYSLQVNARRKEAKSSPAERNAQFQHIDAQKRIHLAAGDPVISVDTKKGTDREF
jgi:hypothetical protein